MSTCSTTGGMMAFFTPNFMLQAPNDSENDLQTPSSFSSIFPPSCSPQDFHGISPMLGKRSMSFQGMHMCSNNDNQEEANNGADGGGGGEEDNISDDGSQLLAGEKKRRLNMEQVKTLEKNFELGNKLEPERKMQLAKALGLQPRQVAIWFQNRRARWKTKQLEKDYELLRSQFDSLKADNEALRSHNQKLQSEILALRGRELPTESINLNKETDQGSCSNGSENSSEIKFDISPPTPAPTTPIGSPLSAPTTTMVAFFPPSSSSSAIINSSSGGGSHRLNGPIPHFFHVPPSSSSRQAPPDLHNNAQKFDHSVKEESFTNMFVGIDDQPGFWPWIEQPNFN